MGQPIDLCIEAQKVPLDWLEMCKYSAQILRDISLMMEKMSDRGLWLMRVTLGLDVPCFDKEFVISLPGQS